MAGDLMDTNRNMVWWVMRVCLILAGAAVITAIVSAFFTDIMVMSNTPVPSSIVAGSMLLALGMLVFAFVLGGIHAGEMHRIGYSLARSTFLRVSRVDNPIRFWFRVVLFSVVAAGLFWGSVWAFMGRFPFPVASP